MEPHPEHLCGAYPYAYPPMPAMVPHHTYKDWSQIRYPPPPMPMEHPPPLPNSRLYHLVSLCPSFLQIPSRKEGQVRGWELAVQAVSQRQGDCRQVSRPGPGLLSLELRLCRPSCSAPVVSKGGGPVGMQRRRDHHQTPSVESGLTLTVLLPLCLFPLSILSFLSFPFLLVFWLLSFSLIFLLPPRVVVTCPSFYSLYSSPTPGVPSSPRQVQWPPACPLL